MYREPERLCRPDVRKAFGFPICYQMIPRGYASAIISTILTGLFALATTAHGQRQQPQPIRDVPGSGVFSPRFVLGFNPGDDRTIADWKQITNYFTRLGSSNRVRVQTIGQSTLGRPLIAAFISAAENIRNLEKYKAIQARLADPRKVLSDEERDQPVPHGKTL